MPQWLISLVEKAVLLILTDVLASHGIVPKTPPTS